MFPCSVGMADTGSDRPSRIRRRLPRRIIRFLGVGDYAPAVGDFGRVVRDSDFVVEQLALDVADQPHQLARLCEQFPALGKFPDPIGEGDEQRLELALPLLTPRFLRVSH